MSRKIVRFPFSQVDQGRVDSISCGDGAPDSPAFLSISFTVTDPVKGAPRAVPLAACKMGFLADSLDGSLALPEPSDIQAWSQAEYDAWQTKGTLVLEFEPGPVGSLSNMFAGVAPSLAWYWPVHVTKEFLFESLRGQAKLRRFDIKVTGGPTVLTSADNWAQHAVSGFLKGTYRTQIGMHASDPAQDDALQYQMPVWDMQADGKVTAWLAVAAGSQVYDGKADIPASVAAADSPRGSPRYPGNALLHARKALTLMRDQMEDAAAGGNNKLADALFAAWPQGPRYFDIRYTAPGETTAVTLCGRFACEKVRISDGSGAVLIEQRLPTSGIITIAQAPPLAGAAPAPPDVVARLIPGDLKITDTNGVRAGLLDSETQFNFGLSPAEGRVTVQSPGAGAAELANVLSNLGKSPGMQAAVAATLEQWASTLRPAGWTRDDDVFHGSRNPWSTVTRADTAAFFDGLQRMAQAGNNGPLIRPQEALVLWVFEGLAGSRSNAYNVRVYESGRSSGPIDTAILFESDPRYRFPAGDATVEAKLRSIARSRLLWWLWGLDTLTNCSSAGADHRMIITGDLDKDSGDHDAAFDNAMQRIRNAGVTPPTRAQVDACITINVPDQMFTTTANYVATHIWLQHAEYLRRILDPQVPQAARDCPAFGYTAFNGTVASAQQSAAQAQAVLDQPHADWIRNLEDALRSWPLSQGEIQLTPRGKKKPRSLALRVLALHFAALVHSYGGAAPHVLYP